MRLCVELMYVNSTELGHSVINEMFYYVEFITSNTVVHNNRREHSMALQQEGRLRQDKKSAGGTVAQ